MQRNFFPLLAFFKFGMSEKTNANMNAAANQKKHARRRRRRAEQHWDELKENGLCPICREHTPNQALCDSCGDCHELLSIIDHRIRGQIKKDNMCLQPYGFILEYRHLYSESIGVRV